MREFDRLGWSGKACSGTGRIGATTYTACAGKHMITMRISLKQPEAKATTEYILHGKVYNTKQDILRELNKLKL